MGTEELVRRYFAAVSQHDHDTAAALRHRSWTCTWPQSGERVTSSEAMRAIVESYPGGAWIAREERLLGSEDRFYSTPAGTLHRQAGSGDVWIGEWVVTYPDGSDYHVIDLVEVRDGRIARETTYWAPPFEAPAWRAAWVERLPAP